MADNPGRKLLREVFEAALGAVQPKRILQRSAVVDGVWRIPVASRLLTVPLPPGRVRVIALGKAGAAAAEGAHNALGQYLHDGLVITKHGHADADLDKRWQVIEAAHPVPDESSIRSGEAALQFARQGVPGDLLVVLLSGGASSLAAVPAPGVTLAEKRNLTQALLRAGADIYQLNRVRRALSQIKAGGLAAASSAPVLTLAVSDVLDNDPAVIGSGPTLAGSPDASGARSVLEAFQLSDGLSPAVVAALERAVPAAVDVPSDVYIIACLDDALNAAAAAGRAAGLDVQRADGYVTGDATAAAHRFLEWLKPTARPTLWLAGGETTVQVSGGGQGGRNQHFALAAAASRQFSALQAHHKLSLLAAGTDGTDGPTPANGAWVDNSTLARADEAGLQLSRYLERHDSHNFFRRLGDTFDTGPTGTNVADLVMAVTGI